MKDPKLVGRNDAYTIDLSDKNEVEHWTKRFRISEAELRSVVERVGILVDNVVKELEPGGYPEKKSE